VTAVFNLNADQRWDGESDRDDRFGGPRVPAVVIEQLG